MFTGALTIVNARWYASVKTILPVMYNLNTHCPVALYEAFEPDQAKALWDWFEFVYMSKHGRWTKRRSASCRASA